MLDTQEFAIGWCDDAFKGMGKGWRGKVVRACCSRCYGSGGGPGEELRANSVMAKEKFGEYSREIIIDAV